MVVSAQKKMKKLITEPKQKKICQAVYWYEFISTLIFTIITIAAKTKLPSKVIHPSYPFNCSAPSIVMKARKSSRVPCQTA